MPDTFSQPDAGDFRRSPSRLALALALLAGCAAALQAGAQSVGGFGKNQGRESSVAFYQFPGAPRITLSRHGNLLIFQTSPGAGGSSHLASEGYVLCYGGAQAYDRAFSEAGFAEPAQASCSGNVCTITRRTIDNVLELRQVITKNIPEERSINIEMTVRNLLGSNISGVVLRRYADFDVDAYGSGTGSTINWWGASEFDSIYAWNAATNHPGIDSAMLMRHLRRTPVSVRYVPKVTHWADTACNPTNFAASGWTQGDMAATIQYNIGVINARQSAVVKVQYQRN